MRIGVPKEVKSREYRVGLVPSSVRELVHHGHEVLVEKGAGQGIGFSDESYQSVGATIVSTPSDVFKLADLIVKIKEPQPHECDMLREDQLLFTFLHLAADPIQAAGLIKSGCIAIAYESVTNERGGLPLLSPMSEVAGRMSVQVGAFCLEKNAGGSGVLLGGVAGVEPGEVLILGGGVVGTNAARMALGLGAHVKIIDKSIPRLQELDFLFGSRARMIYSTIDAIEYHVAMADLVIGAVLLPGSAAPKLVTRDMLKKMKKNSVIVDVAIDQGGSFETSRPTTHDNPTYVEESILHYCVTNMPGAVPRTSTFALNNATLPFILNLANKGYEKAFQDDPHFQNGLTVYKGRVTNEAVARDLKLDYTPFDMAG